MKRVDSVNAWLAAMSEDGKYDPVTERHENGRKVRSDKGKSRCCANCSSYESFPDEYGIYMGGTCHMKNEKTLSAGWCNHWSKN